MGEKEEGGGAVGGREWEEGMVCQWGESRGRVKGGGMRNRARGCVDGGGVGGQQEEG